MTTIILIRHGESEANVQGFFAGNYNAPLSALGRRQAAAARDYLRGIRVDAVYASDLARAHETAEIIAEGRGLTVRSEARLREIRAGEWEGVSFDELMKRYPHDYADVWMHDIGNARCTGGESTLELRERIRGILNEIAAAHEGQTVVAATHATPVRAAMCEAMGVPQSEMQNVHWVVNASATFLYIDNGKWSLGEVGVASYLDGMTTALPTNC